MLHTSLNQNTLKSKIDMSS